MTYDPPPTDWVYTFVPVGSKGEVSVASRCTIYGITRSTGTVCIFMSEGGDLSNYRIGQWGLVNAIRTAELVHEY